jgi:hypothetical protein
MEPPRIPGRFSDFALEGLRSDSSAVEECGYKGHRFPTIIGSELFDCAVSGDVVRTVILCSLGKFVVP